MKHYRHREFIALAIAGFAICATTSRPANSDPLQLAQASAAPLLSGTPEPTEEPTTPPSDVLGGAAAVGPEWAAYTKIVEGANNFIVTYHTHEQKGDVQFTKTIKGYSRKPNYARCEVIAGDGAGSVAVWHGGTNISAHPGGDHAAIIVVLPRHNPRVTDLIGYGCGDRSPANLVGYDMHNGKLSEAPGPTINGEATDDVTWVVNPGDQVHLTKQDLFISKASHLIVASKSYLGDALIEDSTWAMQVDPGIKYSVFDINN